MSISGDDASCVFQVDSRASASISGLTIEGGATPLSGGGLYSMGTLTLTDCTISGNSARSGGGLENTGVATITDCTFSGDTVTYYGGGLENQGVATITGCTFSDNTAREGGGVFNSSKASIGTMTLSDCTISGNSAVLGTGLVNGLGMTTLTACTISGNSAYFGSAGLYNHGGSTSTIFLTDTIVAGNTSTNGEDDDIGGRQAGGVTGSYNLIGPGGSGGVSGGVNGNIVLTSLAGLGLGTLADNGGPTPTIALLPGSPAIEAGTAVAGLTTDQRGQPLDSPDPDIGTFQTQTDQPPLPAFIVTSTADDGSVGTLRWAVAQENAATTPSVIEIELGSAPATIALSQVQLELSNTAIPITIVDPPWEGPVTIDGGGMSRVFQVDLGVTATLSGLTITGGSASDRGGGIYNMGGILNLNDCTITGNYAEFRRRRPG